MRYTSLAAIVFSFLFCVSAISALELSQYPYFKNINIPSSINEPAIAKLDYQVLNYMKPDGSDLRVTENGQEIPLKVFITPVEELAHKGKILAVSSTRPDFRGVTFNANNLIDGDYSGNDNAYYQIDPITDPNYAWVVFELDAPILTDKVKIWSLNNDYTWTELQIEGSSDNSKWDMIKSRAKYEIAVERTIVYPPVEYKFLKFSFWHTQSLVINEMEIYGAYTGQAVFFAKSGREYRLYYGNKQAAKASYDVSALSTKKTTPIVLLGAQQSNPNYNYDSDSDGISQDNCPSVHNTDQKDTDNDGIGDLCDNCIGSANAEQKDTDNDGVGDSCDNCPSNYNADQYDDNLNGRGFACDDNDNDGIINSLDNCASTPNSAQSDKDRNGIGDACEDVDNDGIAFSKDNCISKYNPDQKDSDNDGIGDACDNCLSGYNPSQFDKNSNGIGDSCEDDDKDNVQNYMDNCPNKANNDQKNSDSDSLGDACDNCHLVNNPEQYDADNNGIGDLCDDSDRDGIINPRDNCPSINNPDQKDQNNNGIGDSCEDFDNDGVLNHEDNCLYEHNPKSYVGNEMVQYDEDSDGKGDACDEKDNRLTENKGLIWAVILGTIVIVGILAFRLSRKPIK